MADAEKKARELTAQADKKLYSVGGLFGSLFGGSSKTEEAVDLYEKAANSFKMAKNWKAAGDTFCRCANIHIKCRSSHEAAANFVNAANCYRKTSSSDAVNVLLKAIDIYANMGRFRIVAREHANIAEIFEKDSNIPKAMSHYQIAADFYQSEESPSVAKKCLLKVAEFAAAAEEFEKAIAIYEKVATTSMDDRLLRYGAKEYYFRAALCRLCVDAQDASNSIARYETMFPAFADCRECEFVKRLVAACLDQDADSFSAAVTEFTRYTRLDSWFNRLLSRIQTGLETEYDLR